MSDFVVKRLRFRDGERFSFLSRPSGLPVHEIVLYFARFRTRGRTANTIHAVCMTIALLYRKLDKAGIPLLERLRHGQFLTVPEVNRLADAAQYRLTDTCRGECQFAKAGQCGGYQKNSDTSPSR